MTRLPTGLSKFHPHLTPEMVEERVSLALRGFKEGLRKGEVKALLKHQFGISARTCEDVITAAKRQWIAEVTADPDLYKAESALLYQAICADMAGMISSKKVSQKDKINAARVEIMARQRIDKLFGFEAPEQHEVKGAVIGFSLSDVLRAAKQELEQGEVIDVPQVESEE